jgi:hypothetical protein
VKVVTLRGEPTPSELAAELRALADRVEKGEIVGFAGVYDADDMLSYMTPTTLARSVFLASMLHARIMQTLLVG